MKGSRHRSVLHLLELSSKCSCEADLYTRIGRVYRWPDRYCSGAVQHHTSAEAREPEGGDGCDRITFFRCLKGSKMINSIASVGLRLTCKEHRLALFSGCSDIEPNH